MNLSWLAAAHGFELLSRRSAKRLAPRQSAGRAKGSRGHRPLALSFEKRAEPLVLALWTPFLGGLSPQARSVGMGLARLEAGGAGRRGVLPSVWLLRSLAASRSSRVAGGCSAWCSVAGRARGERWGAGGDDHAAAGRQGFCRRMLRTRLRSRGATPRRAWLSISHRSVVRWPGQPAGNWRGPSESPGGTAGECSENGTLYSLSPPQARVERLAGPSPTIRQPQPRGGGTRKKGAWLLVKAGGSRRRMGAMAGWRRNSRSRKRRTCGRFQPRGWANSRYSPRSPAV